MPPRVFHRLSPSGGKVRPSGQKGRCAFPLPGRDSAVPHGKGSESGRSSRRGGRGVPGERKRAATRRPEPPSAGGGFPLFRGFPTAARSGGGGKPVWPFPGRRFAQNLLTSPRSLAIIQRHPAKAPFRCPPPAGEGHTVPLRPGRGSAGIAQLVEQLIRNQQVACSSHVSSSTKTRMK